MTRREWLGTLLTLPVVRCFDLVKVTVRSYGHTGIWWERREVAAEQFRRVYARLGFRSA
jgi:hypothetical protein